MASHLGCLISIPLLKYLNFLAKLRNLKENTSKKQRIDISVTVIKKRHVRKEVFNSTRFAAFTEIFMLFFTSIFLQIIMYRADVQSDSSTIFQIIKVT